MTNLETCLLEALTGLIAYEHERHAGHESNCHCPWCEAKAVKGLAERMRADKRRKAERR